MLALILIGAFFALTAQTSYTGRSDAPYHILTARAWALGGAIQPDLPTQTKYPPGWSLVLMICARFVGGRYADFARFAAALTPLAILAAYALFRQRFAQRPALVLTAAMVASSESYVIFSRGVRSETLFTAASIGFLAWCEAARTRERFSALWLGFGAFLLVTTVLFRSLGVTLVIAIIPTLVHLWTKNRVAARRVAFRIAAPLAASGVSLGLWSWMKRTAVVSTQSGADYNLYATQFWFKDAHRPSLGMASIGDVILRIPGNLKVLAMYATHILTNFPGVGLSLTSPLIVAAVVLLMAGLRRELARALPLPAYYAIAYVGMLSIVPWQEETRYLIPVVPLILLFAMSGIAELNNFFTRAPERVTRAVAVLALVQVVALIVLRVSQPEEFGLQREVAIVFWPLLLLIVLRPRTTSIIVERARSSRIPFMVYSGAYFVLGALGIAVGSGINMREGYDDADGFQQASAWIAAHTDTSAIIMAQFNLDLELMSGRNGVFLPITSDRQELREAVRRTRARYIFIYNETPDMAFYFPLESDRFERLEAALHQPLPVRARIKSISIAELPQVD